MFFTDLGSHRHTWWLDEGVEQYVLWVLCKAATYVCGGYSNCFATKGELFVTWSDAGWVETHLWSRLKASGERHLCFLLDGLACTFEFWLVSYHHVVVLSDFFVCICEAIVKLVTRGSGVALESLLMESVWCKHFSCVVRRVCMALSGFCDK